MTSPARWPSSKIALQIVLDVGAHLLAARGFTAFDSYRDVIEGLGGTGILPVDFAQSIAGMAGVRNALVHGYASLDPERVGDCVTNRLPDFERFVACVLAYLDGLQAE